MAGRVLTIVNGQTTAENSVALASEFSNGSQAGPSYTVNWNNGNNQVLTLAGDLTLSFTAPSVGVAKLLVRLVQDATGSRTVTWPATVRWPGGTPPTLTTTANAIDIVALYWNGTNYYAQASLAFA